MSIHLGPGDTRRDVTLTPTAPPFELILTSPTGGEQWSRGSTYNVTWEATNIDELEPYYRRWTGEGWVTLYMIGGSHRIAASAGLYSWTIPIDTSVGSYTVRLDAYKNGTYVGFAESELFNIIGIPEIGTYTVGLYYCYCAGYEDSTETCDFYDIWWPDWEARTAAIISPHISRWIDFIRHYGLPADMTTLFTRKLAINTPPCEVCNQNLVVNAIAADSYYNEIHLAVGGVSPTIRAGNVAWRKEILTQMDKLEAQNRGFDGVSPFTCHSTLAHEWGHLFGALAHCNSPEGTCIMSKALPNITYEQWLDRGQILWFCDSCRELILAGWREGRFL